ncbi:MAG: phosphomannomutase/phosphoglucomutase [Pseudomonadales bacterium]
MTTPTRQRRTGEGVWNSALLIVALGLLGLAISAGVLWLQLVQGSNQAHIRAIAEARAEGYAGLIEARVGLLRAELSAAAAAPATLSALTSGDAASIAAQSRELTSVMPFAERVEIIPAGAARLDLDAAVPISYAALNVIQRAESEPFVGPDGVRLDGQSSRFYAAGPVLESGGVAGVLFAALSADFLIEPVTAHAADSGQVRLEQRFEGTESVTLLQWGNTGGAEPDAAHQVTLPLGVRHWQIVFHPNLNAIAPVASMVDLLTALAASLGMFLAAVLFAFSSLSRKLRHDSRALLEQASNAMRGRRLQAARFKLGMFQDMAREIGRMARPVGGDGADDAPAAKSGAGGARKGRARPSEAAQAEAEAGEPDGVQDLLDDDEPTPKRKRPADSDDFLEVSRAGGAPSDNFGIEVTEDNSPIAMGLELEPEIFRSYDIRGITTSNLTEEVVYWIGRAFAAEAIDRDCRRVAVGRDGRHSSAPLRDALCRGLTEGGADVLDIGQVPTPVLYFATHVLDTGTGVMITGSHNPPEYNGLKMMIGGETLAEERIQALRARIEENRLSEGEGDTETVNIAAQYLDRIVNDVVVAQPLKVVVDCGNGVAGNLAPELISQLGCEVVPLYCDVDGDFPNHHPDPAEPKNLEDLITVVKAEKAALGLAFDGDGDRLGVVTARGEIIWPDKLLMLYAQDIVARNPGADVIYDVKCSRHLNSLISDLGGRPIMCKTGHSHIKAKLKETGALLAGEFSGHICFGERWYGFDDALYSAARLLEILGSTDKSADELFAQFPATYSTPELKIQTTEREKFEIIQRLAIDGEFGDGTITTIDGVRVDYPDGWGLIRPSNTSPVLSLRFEADGQEALDRIQALFQEQLARIDPQLRFR